MLQLPASDSIQWSVTEDRNTEADPPTLNWICTGPPDAPTVVFLHAVGYDLTYWDRQIEALSPAYRVVAFDLPGHGRSPGRAEDWSFGYAVAAVSRLIEAISPKPVHLVGISFGGMIAQATVLARPDLFRSLTLIGTAASFPEPARVAMRARAELTRSGGMQAVLPSSLDRWFTPQTRLRRPDLIDRVAKTMLADDPAVHAAIWELIATFDVHDRLSEIHCPTLVMVGELDPSTPPAAATALADAISGARVVLLPNTSHMANLESSEAVNVELRRFLDAH